MTCDNCKKEIDPKEDTAYRLCNECNDNLPNSTGYCSIWCRTGNGCDGSC